jgi:hypothetical protein
MINLLSAVKSSVKVICLISLLLAGRTAIGVTINWPEPGVIQHRKIDYSVVTYYVSKTGSDKANGRTKASAFASLQHAADVVHPGETVLLTKGVYHQCFHISREGRPGAWIVFEAEPGATIDGAEIRKDWEPVQDLPAVYSIDRPALLDMWQQPDTEIQNRMEQVFVNGSLLRQVSQREMLKPKNVFWVDESAKKMYVSLKNGANPNQERTDVSSLSYAVSIGAPPNLNWWTDEKVGLDSKAAYIKIDGFTVRHIADFPRMAAIEVRGICHDVVIENCDVQWSSYCGIAGDSVRAYNAAEGKWFDDVTQNVVVSHCTISNNGCEGVGGGQVSDELIENNLIENNNYKGISPWNEGGGVKICEVGRTIFRNNVLINNNDEGLWFDTGYTGCVIENNLIFGSLAAGILDEVTPAPPQARIGGKSSYPAPSAAAVHALSADPTFKGTIIRNNIVVDTRVPNGFGIAIATSPNANLTNNILYGNDGAAISDGGSPTRNETLGLWGTRVEHNICDQNFAHIQIMTDSSDPGGRFFDNVVEDNLFLRSRSTTPFNVNGVDVALSGWLAATPNETNIYAQSSLFKDPDHFDFTIVNPTLARRVGFDSNAIRLNWKAFFPVQAPLQDQASSRIAPSPVRSTCAFGIGFDGDIDATGSDGGEIVAQGFNEYAFDAGKFVSGLVGSAFVPTKPLFYDTPSDFPARGSGTISIWLNADDWTSPDRISAYRSLDYTRTMVPLSTGGSTPRYAPWSCSFIVDKDNFSRLDVDIELAGQTEDIDLTPLIKPRSWFNLCVTWQPGTDAQKGTLRRTYLNGHLISEKTFNGVPDVVGNLIYVGVPSNGGQPWRGAMSDLTIDNIALSGEQIAVAASKMLGDRG